MVSHFPSSNSSAFLAIPLEIRRQIYRLCIPQKLCFDVSSGMRYQNRSDLLDEINDCHLYNLESSGISLIDREDDEEGEHELSTDTDDEEIIYPFVDGCRQSALPGLLLCCRQITEEVTDMLYGGNTFQVKIHGDGQYTLARLFDSRTREKIRKMVLILQPMGVSYHRDFHMDQNIWDSILGNLSILGVIAEQPESLSLGEWPKAEPENAVKEWTAWITPIFEYLGRALNRETKMVVDANDKKETLQVLEKAIPGRCRFQHLPMADIIFKRGRFSLESGYWDDFDDGPTSCRDIIDDCDYDYYYSD
ncbi:hypothetical protein HDV63DRAFT_413162 [Trichoderma sp. SZMC 28014]